MKRIFVCFLFLSISLIPTTRANVGEIPSSVLETFQKKFPDVRKVNWTKIDGQYIASFEQGEKAFIIASFDILGQWKVTETQLETCTLPEFIQNYILNNYAASTTIETIHLIEQPGKEYFSIGLETINGFVTLEINAQGHLAEL